MISMPKLPDPASVQFHSQLLKDADQLSATIHDITQQATTALDQKLDHEIRIAINAALGHENWMIYELQGRLTWIKYAYAEYEDLTLDGHPLLRRWPIESKLENNQLIATRNIARFK
jgi:hypothetical protein